MRLKQYDAFCGSLPHATCVVQWGGAHVWKVAGKVFAIAWQDEPDARLLVTFKCSELSYDLLKELEGCRPAPYMASRGLKWIQRTGPETINDGALRDYLAESYRLVATSLPKRAQAALGLGSAKPASGAATATASAERLASHKARSLTRSRRKPR